MLDFRRRRTAAKPLGFGLEGRLLTLLVGSGLVVLLVLGAGNPRNWRWAIPDGGAAAPQQRVRNLPEPTVVAAGEEKVPDTLFPGVRGDYLSAVRDDTVFPPGESDAWFHLFALVARTDDADLVRASEGPVTYLQLNRQPSAYRGHLVTVSGVARAAKLVKAPANAFGVDQYYQLWLQPDPSAPELVVLYCHELPKGFPLGDEIDTACTAVGFFFKRWAYQSQGGIATAPLLIARTIEWQPPVVAAPVPTMPLGEQLLTAAAVALVLAVVALVFVVARGRGTIKPRSTADDSPGVSAALESLANDERPIE